MSMFSEPEWWSEDAHNLAEFLKTRTGKRVVENLAFRRPSFELTTAHPHKSFARSRDIAGYEQAVQTLISLTVPVEQPDERPANPSYPDLEDDTQWPQP